MRIADRSTCLISIAHMGEVVLTKNVLEVLTFGNEDAFPCASDVPSDKLSELNQQLGFECAGQQALDVFD